MEKRVYPSLGHSYAVAQYPRRANLIDSCQSKTNPTVICAHHSTMANWSALTFQSPESSSSPTLLALS